MGARVDEIVDSQDGKCLPDSPSDKDWPYAEYCGTLPTIAPGKERDLRNGCSAVQTQGRDSSCVAQAVVSAIEFLQRKDCGDQNEQWSRYFVYYNARVLQQDTPNVADIGTTMRHGIAAVAKKGVCVEKLWPYLHDNLNERPSENCYGSAKLHELVKYWRLQNDTIEELRDCLWRGFPFVFLMRYGSAYPEDARETGHVRLPSVAERRNPESLATHAVMAVGYNDETQRLMFMNSKGPGWGRHGFGELDYEYVTDEALCRDFWTIRKVEDLGASPRQKTKR